MNRSWVSEASNGHGFIHKSKLNANGTFSVGKTWKLEDLRGIEIVNVRLLLKDLALDILMTCICCD